MLSATIEKACCKIVSGDISGASRAIATENPFCPSKNAGRASTTQNALSSTGSSPIRGTSMSQTVSLLFIAFVAAVGAYFGAYFRQKGWNVATKEDIREITKSREAGKAEISSHVWLEQKRWEIKQKFYWDVIGKLHDLVVIVRKMAEMIEKCEIALSDENQMPFDQNQFELWKDQSEKIILALDKLTEIFSIVVSEGARKEFDQFMGDTYHVMSQPAEGDNHLAQVLRKIEQRAQKLLGTLIDTAKSDLQIALPNPQR